MIAVEPIRKSTHPVGIAWRRPTGKNLRSGIHACICAIASLLAILIAHGSSILYAAPAEVPLAGAEADLEAGKADEAIALLNQALHANPNDPEANNLLCRVEFTLQEFDPAAGHCEKAVQLRSQDSRYHLWLGRATGERAARASFLSAFALAKRTRAEFETAVQLDPHNADALADLGEFYKDAPGAVGGGIDKAQNIAKQLEEVDLTRAHVLRGLIAERQKDLTAAEQEYKAAITGPHPARGWMALASFYRRQQRWPEMESAVKSGTAAAAHDRHAAVALFDGASILARANRQPDLAIQLYQSYLASPDKTEEAPAFEALVRLAKLLQQKGDSSGAQQYKSVALSLAHEYRPAQELKL